jgi:hypothetical protein
MLGTLVLICPSAVFAQASIAGVVRDTSQAILPGVTVEAASPALIEKVRSVVTDATGQYRIVDLRPGTYTVTFTLPGFSSVKREGIELTGSFVATVNVELRVGAVEETITVTGETPVVDVQQARTQAVLSNDIVTAIPTARNYQNLHVLVPGVTIAAGNQDVGGAAGDQQIFFAAHGGSVFDSRVQVNGLMVGDSSVGGGRTLFIPSVGTAQETNITTSGGLGEAETAGVIVNIIPKDGGNIFSGTIFGTGANESLISENYDDQLRGQGLRAPNNVKNVWDVEGAFGGPVLRDKLWFFGNGRVHGNANFIAGMFPNRNSGNVNVWTYDPNLAEQAVLGSHWTAASLRLTWQANERNKFVASYEDQMRCVACPSGGSATSSPEASGRGILAHPSNVGQITWTSPVTNRLLLEGGFSLRQVRWGNEPLDGTKNPDLIRVTAQGGSIPGLSYRACNCGGKSGIFTYASRASITYTTGAHSMKFGYNGTRFDQERVSEQPNALNYRFTTPDAGGVPNQLTMLAVPRRNWVHVYTGGFYGQDQWTLNRLTLGAGLRYDIFTTFFPASQVGPIQFVPTPIVFPDERYALLHDVTTRFSAAYDLFGDGKTAVKTSMGKYVIAQDGGNSPLGYNTAPALRIATSTSRAWNDTDRDFVPDCDLVSRVANGECGPISNLNFGTANVDSNVDREVLRGWGKRPYNWSFDVALQRELVPRVSATVTYFRRWFGNFLVTDNLATAAADYTSFNLPLPADPRLPVSGTIAGYTNVVPARFGQVNNLVTAASNYGKQTQRWNGVDLSIDARLEAITVQGGISTGRESNDNCEIVAKLPEMLGSNPAQYCQVDAAFMTQVKLLGAYTVPRVDVQVSATLQNIPGQEMQANWVVPNATVAPLLGRPLAGGAANVTLALLPPFAHLSDRVNQVDFRLAKILRFGTKRTQITFDMYNALNANTVQTFNASYNPTGAWRIPTAILPARVMKFSAQLDF